MKRAASRLHAVREHDDLVETEPDGVLDDTSGKRAAVSARRRGASACGGRRRARASRLRRIGAGDERTRPPERGLLPAHAEDATVVAHVAELDLDLRLRLHAGEPPTIVFGVLRGVADAAFPRDTRDSGASRRRARLRLQSEMHVLHDHRLPCASGASRPRDRDREIDAAAARGFRQRRLHGRRADDLPEPCPSFRQARKARGFGELKIASNGLRYAHAPFLDHLIEAGANRFHVSMHAFSDEDYERTVQRADTALLRRAASGTSSIAGNHPVADLILKADTYRHLRPWIRSLVDRGIVAVQSVARVAHRPERGQRRAASPDLRPARRPAERVRRRARRRVPGDVAARAAVLPSGLRGSRRRTPARMAYGSSLPTRCSISTTRGSPGA